MENGAKAGSLDRATRFVHGLMMAEIHQAEAEAKASRFENTLRVRSSSFLESTLGQPRPHGLLH